VSLPIDQCTELSSHKRLVLAEKASKVTILNRHERLLVKIEVDGCVFTDRDQERRCDYLVNSADLDTSIFVELKGSDVGAAYDQLRASHDRLADCRKSRVTWIVSTRRCTELSANIQNRKDKAMKEHRAFLVVKNGPFDFDIETKRPAD